MELTLPYNWVPRDYQMPAWLALEEGIAKSVRGQVGINRSLLFWHRRAGKDLFCVNLCATQAMQRIGAYWHIFPTYRQGRKIAWEGKTRDGRSFVDHFPKAMIERRRDAEMTLNFINPYAPDQPGSSYHIIGADDPDSQVGTNPVGMIFSEWAVMTDPAIWSFLQPILIENDGWALFITTPRGRNHAYRMMKRNESNPRWFVQVLGVDKTLHEGNRVVNEEQIDAARQEGMTEDMVQQEFYCSFDAALENAYYGPEMRKALSENRITHVPFDPHLQVETWWDLGMADATAIWFAQRSMGQIRLIDYEYATGQSLAYYADLLHRKREEWTCTYRAHLLPHDANARSLQTGYTTKKSLRDLGIENIRVMKKHGLQDGIQATRMMLPTCWFDEERCATGIEGLRQYVKQPLEGQEDPDGNQLYSNQPLHNWASHPADAFRTGAMGSKIERPPGEPEQLFAPMSMA